MRNFAAEMLKNRGFAGCLGHHLWLWRSSDVALVVIICGFGEALMVIKCGFGKAVLGHQLWF
jgi:hypothetical protein